MMGLLIRGMLHSGERPTTHRTWIATSGAGVLRKHVCVRSLQENEIV